MIKVKSQEEIIKEIISDIKTNSTDGIATYVHSPAYDIFVEPLSRQEADSEVLADFISRSRSLDEMEEIVNTPDYINNLAFAIGLSYNDTKTLISTTLNNLVSNWNETRKTAQKSKGIIRLYFNSNSNVTLNAGLTFETEDGKQFITTNSFNNFVPYYDSLEGLYYVDSAIESVIAGAMYNVIVGTIIVNNNNGIQKVVNLKETKFGRDLETDIELIQRVRESWKSREVSTLSGLVRKVKSFPGVYDCSVVMPFDSLQVRNEKNAVDIYILGEEQYQPKIDNFNIVSAKYAYDIIDDELNYEVYPIPYDSTGYTYFKLLNQPLITVNSVQYSSTPSGTFSDIPDDSYEIITDTSGVFKKSVRGNDVVKVLNSAITATGWVKVNYVYDSIYENLQNLIMNYENSIIGADILFKKAQEQNVDISVLVSIFEGSLSLSEIQQTIVDDLTIFFGGGTDSNGIIRTQFKLGQKLDKSDIADVILSVQGVDFVDLDSFSVKIDDVEMGTTYKPDITKYLNLNTVTFLVKTVGTIEPITSR